MPRYTIVYTNDGRSFLKGSPEHEAYLGEGRSAPKVFGDEPDFVSPIDGKVYSGKTGMREHNRRHDVINNRDLVGLPVGVSGSRVSSLTERREIRNTIIETARRKGYLNGQ
jgi:hypothetical protein